MANKRISSQRRVTSCTPMDSPPAERATGSTDDAALRAVLRLALGFETWRSLVRGQSLTASNAVDLVVRLVRCAAN
jgi:hypothetical protein